uniref:Putative secreted protein n=1 Tax=Amblyomma triste TaxID=251400 RepID=A0A023G9P1_AMBTT
MSLTLLGALTILASNPILGHVCTPRDVIARNLEIAPDAWKLMSQTEGKFFLVYHSEDGTFHRTYPCLNAIRNGPARTTTKEAEYYYSHLTSSGFMRDTRNVKLDKKDDAYENYNEFTIDLSSGADQNVQDFQVIYTDYSDCILFWYWKLGERQ